jgi:hypothetical protein
MNCPGPGPTFQVVPDLDLSPWLGDIVDYGIESTISLKNLATRPYNQANKIIGEPKHF